jgi:hypothetical protein
VNKILIANRGEIACRVIRSAQALGARTVAVYSDADRESLHVASADEAIHIGPAKAAESYLNIDALLAAAAAYAQRALIQQSAPSLLPMCLAKFIVNARCRRRRSQILCPRCSGHRCPQGAQWILSPSNRQVRPRNIAAQNISNANGQVHCCQQ